MERLWQECENASSVIKDPADHVLKGWGGGEMWVLQKLHVLQYGGKIRLMTTYGLLQVQILENMAMNCVYWWCHSVPNNMAQSPTAFGLYLRGSHFESQLGHQLYHWSYPWISSSPPSKYKDNASINLHLLPSKSSPVHRVPITLLLTLFLRCWQHCKLNQIIQHNNKILKSPIKQSKRLWHWKCHEHKELMTKTLLTSPFLWTFWLCN
jgi:hypothetical protein